MADRQEAPSPGSDGAVKRDRDAATDGQTPGAQRPPRVEDAAAAVASPTAIPSGETRQTRKGERFLDPKAVALYTKDFTLDSVVDKAPPMVSDQSGGRVLSVDVVEHVQAQATSWEGHYKTNHGLYPIKNYIAQAFPTVFLAWAASDEKAAAAAAGDEAAPDDDAPRRLILDCGCGVGSALLPLAGLLPRDRFVGFDISPSAVAKLNEHERTVVSNGRIRGFAHDIALQPLPEEYSGAADAVLLVFVLSAIGTSKQQDALQRLCRCMKPDGVLCFRDYGRFDHNERRFFNGGNKVVDGGYVKGDGTQQCFFELDATRALFARAGFVEVQPLEYHFNRVHNRKTDVEMRKVFINGVFKPAPPPQ